MVCPKCKMEYEDWVRECSDCNVPLVTDRELAEIEEEKRRQRQEERERKIQGKMEVSAEDIRKWNLTRSLRIWRIGKKDGSVWTEG